MIEYWQRIDKDHSVCAECCVPFANKDVKGGLCRGCKIDRYDRRENIMTKATTRLVQSAAAEFMAQIRNQSKEGAAMPRIMDRFYEAIGGMDRVGDMLAEDFMKARGADGNSNFEYNAKVALAYFELICRHQAKIDEGRQLDVSGLDEDSLNAVIAGVAEKWIANNPEYRKEMFKKIIQSDRELANLALEMAGSPRVDAESVKIITDAEYDPHDDVFEGEEYLPSEDESEE
jgi:hypothetical protein